jgi:membrane fusion protein (multidrug efflux system)
VADQAAAYTPGHAQALAVQSADVALLLSKRATGVRQRTSLMLGAAWVTLLLAACGGSTGTPAGGAPAASGAAASGAAARPAGPPPAPVGVVTVETGRVAINTELPGRLEAWRVAQVRARVPGIVKKRVFTEGSEVREGQALYQLDDAPYRAALESALANQARAEANLAQGRTTLERNEPLAAARAISQTEWVASQTAVKLAEADVASSKAAVTTARLNLDYAAVTAPLGGRIGRALVNEGALVGQGEATQLALIQQIHPLYINFTLSASEVMRLRGAWDAGQLKKAPAGQTPGGTGGPGAALQVVLEDGSTYPMPGRLLFSDLSVDPGTGQVSLRAELPNPERRLLPGLYVKVRLVLAQAEGAVLLPQQAVTRSPAGDTVLVIGEDNVPVPRPVKVAGSQSGPQGSQWVISSGLSAGERVVVDGFQKIRPKSPVSPVPWTPGGKPPGPGAPGSAAPAGAASAGAMGGSGASSPAGTGPAPGAASASGAASR